MPVDEVNRPKVFMLNEVKHLCGTPVPEILPFGQDDTFTASPGGYGLWLPTLMIA